MIRTCLPMLLSLAACSFPLTSEPSALDFTSRPATSGAYAERPELTVTGSEGRIVVEAGLSTPDPCREISGALRRSGSELTLEVTIQRSGEICIAAIGAFEYTATIRDLAPGEYRLRVVHEFRGTGWAGGTVLDQQVLVTPPPARTP
ncbi:MAG: hypothetical protein M3409_00975 [Gemmatimonadota bacterium]|nr:hypothetical protein [Gemmatimonadota bacterium]